MTDNPQIDDAEVTFSDIGDAEADAERREDDLLRAVLTGLAIFSIITLRWSRGGRDIDEQALLETLAQEEQERALDLYAALSGGTIDLGRWLADMTTNLRRFHLQATAIGRGGFDAITQADLNRLEGFLVDEFGYLREFGGQLPVMSEAQAQARLQLYHNHAQTSYWEARQQTQIELGRTECRRQLNPAEHCADCERYASQSWQPIGTLPPPGQESECRTNCKCTMEFR